MSGDTTENKEVLEGQEPPKEDQVTDPPKDEGNEPPKDDKTTKPDDKAGDTEGDDQGDEPVKDQDLDTETWGDTGTDVGNSMLLVLQESGIEKGKAKELLWDAVQSKDPDKVDFDALAEAMGSKAQARLVLSGMKSYLTDIETRTKEVTSVLHKEVGSKEGWDTLVEWAKENLSDKELKSYVEMVGEGGRKARMAARDLMEQYEEAGNTSLKDATVVPKSNPKATDKIQPISRVEYFEKLDMAQRTGKLTDKLKAELFAARQAGKKAGK